MSEQEWRVELWLDDAKVMSSDAFTFRPEEEAAMESLGTDSDRVEVRVFRVSRPVISMRVLPGGRDPVAKKPWLKWW